MLRYILSLLLILAPTTFLVGSEEMAFKPRAAEYYCSWCTKMETINYFKWCTKCTIARYCSQKCYDQDTTHQAQCSTISLEREVARIETKRKPFALAFEKRTFPKRVEFTNETLSEVLEKLDQYGDLYRLYLNEECIGSLAIGDTADAEKAAHYYEVSCMENLMKIFPVMLQGTVESIFRDYIFYMEYVIPHKLEKNGKMKELEHFQQVVLPFYKKFEAYRSEGSLYRNKGYPAAAENALECLRKKIMLKFKEVYYPTDDSKSASLFLKNLTIIWVYYILCTIPCLHLTKTQEFIDSIMHEDHSQMVSCLQHSLIMRHAFLTDNKFIFAVEEQICPIENFLKLITLKRITQSDGNILLSDHFQAPKEMDVFTFLSTNISFIPLSLAHFYHAKLGLSLTAGDKKL